jgi:hypothetical protein
VSENFLNETKRLYEAIGAVVIEFQFVEHTLAEVLSWFLNMRESEDRFRVAAAMSFRQKVDLLCDLYPNRRVTLREVNIGLVRRALYAAEDFRNRVVHSYWFVEEAQNPETMSSSIQWSRRKASLRGKAGFKLSHSAANPEQLERGTKAMLTIRDWYVNEEQALESALQELFVASDSLKEQPYDSPLNNG